MRMLIEQERLMLPQDTPEDRVRLLLAKKVTDKVSGGLNKITGAVIERNSPPVPAANVTAPGL